MRALFTLLAGIPSKQDRFDVGDKAHGAGMARRGAGLLMLGCVMGAAAFLAFGTDFNISGFMNNESLGGGVLVIGGIAALSIILSGSALAARGRRVKRSL